MVKTKILEMQRGEGVINNYVDASDADVLLKEKSKCVQSLNSCG